MRLSDRWGGRKEAAAVEKGKKRVPFSATVAGIFSRRFSSYQVEMPYLVREHLFIGNITDAAEILQNGSNEITHILSLLSSASISFFSEWRSEISIPAAEIRKVSAGEYINGDGSKTSLLPDKLLYSLEHAGKDLKFLRMAVPLRDMESEDLLDYLDVCLDFIEDSRKKGSILVHCFAGVSRSAAIITAYLMKSEQLSQEDAVESLRQCCETVYPNDGFLEQLRMFEQMGFKVDHASPVYKRFRLKILGDSYNRGEKIGASMFGADPAVKKLGSDVESSPAAAAAAAAAYRCKKCRRVVALKENVVAHAPGEGQSSFEWYRRRSGDRFSRSDLDDECTSIFLEPLSWMTAVKEGGLEGKLQCGHCDGRLGYFSWCGVQCSCGSWISPAFQVHKNRVDISSTTTRGGGGGGGGGGGV